MRASVISAVDFSHPFAIMLTLVPALINFFIFLYVAVYLPKNQLNISFTLFLLLLAFWQMSEGFMHISVSEETSMQWYRVSGIPSLGVGVFEVLFALQFSGWHKRVPAVAYYVFLIIPGLFLTMSIAGHLDSYTISASPLWNWVASPDISVYTDILYLSLTVYAIIALLLFLFSYIRARGQKKKRQQALFLLIGFSIPMIGGSITEVILPLVFGMKEIPVTTPLITVFSILALIAIKRYGLLDYSPRYQWESVLKTINDGIVIVDNNQVIVYTNEKFSELTMYTADELAGRELTDFIYDEASRKMLAAAKQERQNNRSGHYQLMLNKKDGSLLWLNVSGFPYLDKAGNVTGAVGVVTDITELMNVQTELKKKVNDLNIFFYKTAHDFKTPIASMHGLLDVYSKDDNIEELLHYVKLCVKNLSQIVNRVSQLSVIQQQQVITSEISFEALLEKLLKETEKENPLLETVKIITDIRVPVIVSEVFLLSSILKNLVDNAIRYSDPDKEATVTIMLDDQTGMYELKVKDNGIGIPADIREKYLTCSTAATINQKAQGWGCTL